MAAFDITHTQWDTYLQNYSFTDNAWDAIDITWAVIVMSIKQNIADAAVLLTATFTHISDVWWTASVTFTPAQMALALNSYWYDVSFQDSTWVITTLLKWSFIVTFDVT